MDWWKKLSEVVRVSDLVLTDEHDIVRLDDNLAVATRKLLDIGRGVLIVLGDDEKVKGIVTANNILNAVAEGGDPKEEQCSEHMDADVMEVNLDDEIDDIITQMNERKPHAVVAVDGSGAFSGYFSPNDYREALSRIEERPAIQKLAIRD
jgi:predicted transcriptional regulator